MIITKFDSREALAEALADIAMNDAFASVAFSGGGTPKLLLETLARRSFNKTAILVDDRQVPVHDADSNRGLLRETLGVEPPELTPTSTSDADLIILGLGNDGHTMSLFPGQPDTNAAFGPEPCDYVATRPNRDDGNVQVDRISMTAAPLRRAARVILHIEGEAKLESWENFSADAASPIGRVAHDPDISFDVFWTA